MEEVECHLRNLDIAKSCVPDGIPARVLEECRHHIAPGLCDLFNLSLRVRQLLTQWKKANVTQVHKKDPQDLPENFRPISLLPIIVEVLERSVLAGFMIT